MSDFIARTRHRSSKLYEIDDYERIGEGKGGEREDAGVKATASNVRATFYVQRYFQFSKSGEDIAIEPSLCNP